MTSKIVKTTNHTLLALLNDRQEIMHDISDLKYKQQEIEHRVKKRLIIDGDVDLLSVNWSKLRRLNHR